MHIQTVAASALCCAAGASAVPTGSSETESATEFSLTYGYPLRSYAKLAGPGIVVANGTNNFYHMRTLAAPQFKAVVRPNVDTLYSTAALDLSRNDLIVTIPEVNDRYWAFSFYDVYGSDYVNVGLTGKNSPGKYLVRYRLDNEHRSELQLCDSKSEDKDCEGVKGIINAVTPYGSLQPRFEVMDGSTEDLKKIFKLQDQSTITKVPHINDGATPPLSLDLLSPARNKDEALSIMQLTARIAPHNPPQNLSDTSRVNSMLKEAGIKNGKYTRPVGLNLTRALGITEKRAADSVQLPSNSINLDNEWHILASQAQGDFDTNYLARQNFAQTLYLGLTQSETFYPAYQSLNPAQTLNIGAKEAYIVTMSSKPKLGDGGFWSMTMYNSQGYLIENDLKTYSLSDRGNLTYADGVPVYRNEDHEDSSFQLLIQPADVQPPQNWTTNWLPAPSGGGEFSMTLRFYVPQDAMKNGDWSYPFVQKQAAIEQ